MKLALAQTNIIWEDKDCNFNSAKRFISDAKSSNCDLILFPEMSFSGFSFNIDKLAEDDNFTIKKMKEFSNFFNISIGFGYIEKFNLNGKIYGKNNYCIVNNDTILCNYTKIHPFSFSNENLYFIPGKKISYCSINNIIISPFICYDLRFPELFQAASNKAHLITVAANWPIERISDFKLLLQARAIENQCYIAGINRFGNGNNLSYNGCSCIFTPTGKLLDCLSDTDGLVFAEINSDLVTSTQKNFPIKNDRKPTLYASFYTD